MSNYIPDDIKKRARDNIGAVGEDDLNAKVVRVIVEKQGRYLEDTRMRDYSVQQIVDLFRSGALIEFHHRGTGLIYHLRTMPETGTVERIEVVNVSLDSDRTLSVHIMVLADNSYSESSGRYMANPA